ncbi:MAG: aminotransferase class V-fold PLP-dependent enzyme [Candidatus Micrarchaeota archaeon]
MTILLAPGPVPVLEDIRMAQTKEMITHRTREFTALYSDLCGRLKNYFGAEEAYVITGSGALGLEALFANLTFKNESLVCFPNGEFGEKLAETAKIYTNVIVNPVTAVTSFPTFANVVNPHAAGKEGSGWNLERAKSSIDNSNAQVLAMVYNETSFGVRNNIKEICKYAKSRGMITIIDGISAWPGTELNMREFEIDGFVTGSQKGIGAPPGMALVGLSKEAIERFSKRDSVPSYYLDFRRHKKRYEKDQQTPNTPAVSLFWALQKGFDVLDRKGGLESCISRHADAAAHVRKRLTSLGFKLIAERGFESNTVTGFACEGKGSMNGAEQAKTIKDQLDKQFGIKIVGSRGAFKDNGLRIAHMGNFEMKWLDDCLDAMENIGKE